MVESGPIVVLGAQGMLGQALVPRLEKTYPERSVVLMDIGECDITDPACCDNEVLCSSPLLFNCAAYTAVDRAEEERELAFAVNRDGVRNLAAVAQRSGALLVHISTDFVFSGEGEGPYPVDAPCAPLSVYGASKRAGEEALMASGCRFLLIRTSWLYGHGGGNFVETILSKGAERAELTVIDDQRGRPTYCGDLAWAMDYLSRTGVEGVYHFSNQGVASWYEFAAEIVKQGGVDTAVTPCGTDAYPLPAPRPRNSVLDLTLTEVRLPSPIRPWQDALKEYLSSR
jgi:dTDP-4-dehydrorhamnose reductase